MNLRWIKRYYRRRMRFRLPVRLSIALAIVIVVMFAILIAALLHQAVGINVEELSTPWHYYCDAGLCKKEAITENVTVPLSLELCQIFCDDAGSLWPKPTGHLSLGNFVAQLNTENIELSGISLKSKAGTLLQRNVNEMKKRIRKRKRAGVCTKKGGKGLAVHISNNIDDSNVVLTLDTKENYTLHIYELEDNRINASITAETYFGARHALETLSQLIVFNELRNEIVVVRDAYIVDGPVYPYRGVGLDTARNFMSKSSILRTIEAMSMSKLNTFHWHITDSHSFPYVSSTWPNMSLYGAYTPQKIYTQSDIEEIVDFGLLHGVRVVPELDAPAHVGEGWQWVGDNAVLCFKAEPWKSFCVEPPCGQLNPASDRVYEILEGLYKDMIRDFHPDVFHMGGDEINIGCWKTSNVLKDWMKKRGWNTTDSDFVKAWDYFQTKAFEKLTIANGGKEIPAIIWTSELTNEENIHLLDPKKYIIQIWTTRTDAHIARLIKNKFRVIFSNYDALYLDCGFGAWVGRGNNWCSPYKGWQTVYDNSPKAILFEQNFTAGDRNLILGGEAVLWAEQADSSALDSRLWPRAAAFGERLWTEPDASWIHAEQRMLRHRERLVQRGISADSLEPEWCRQNQGHCYA